MRPNVRSMVKSVMSMIGSSISSLKNPEYTGANRCPPCTAVNVGLAALVGVALGAAIPVLGVIAVALSILVIYFRGYLIPGTPRLTKRYLPDTVLKRFEHEPPALTDGGGDGNPLFDTIEKVQYRREHGVDPEAYLNDAGAVETTSSGDGRALTPSFRDRVEDTAEAFDGVIDAEFVGEMFDATPEEISVPDRDYPAIQVRRRIRRWPSEAAFIADIASHRVLEDLCDDWTDVPIEQRVNMLKSIRSLWETCPSCGGSITFDEEIVTSCCREFEVVTYRCQSCESHFVELDPEDVTSGIAKKGVVP